MAAAEPPMARSDNWTFCMVCFYHFFGVKPPRSIAATSCIHWVQRLPGVPVTLR